MLFFRSQCKKHSCCCMSKWFICLFRELARRERLLANPLKTVPGARLKVVCSTSSTVMALQWVQNQSRPTESLRRKGWNLRVQITMTYLSQTQAQTCVCVNADSWSQILVTWARCRRALAWTVFLTLCSVKMYCLLVDLLICVLVEVTYVSVAVVFSLGLLLMMLKADCAYTKFSAAVCYLFDPAMILLFPPEPFFCFLPWCVPLDIVQTVDYRAVWSFVYISICIQYVSVCVAVVVIIFIPILIDIYFCFAWLIQRQVQVSY